MLSNSNIHSQKIGKFLKVLRTERGETQQKMNERIKKLCLERGERFYTQGAIAQFESGKIGFPFKRIRLFEDAYCITDEQRDKFRQLILQELGLEKVLNPLNQTSALDEELEVLLKLAKLSPESMKRVIKTALLYHKVDLEE